MSQKPLYEAKNALSGGSVDWLTATTQSQSMGMSWLAKFNDYRQKEDKTVPAGARGFKGMKSGQLSWMFREYDERYMMVARSRTANTMWAEMVGPKTQVTRIDWAVDIDLNPAKPGLPGEMFRVLSKVDVPWVTSVIMNSKLGQTLYSGSRNSEVYGRLYDKGVQTGAGEPGAHYRYEVEIKGRRAREATGAMEQFKGNADGLPAWISENVSSFFSERFVPVAFDITATKVDWQTAYVRQTDARKRLTWLRSQVKPSVEWLFEIGLGSDVLYALGIGAETCTKYAHRVKQPSSKQILEKGGKSK